MITQNRTKAVLTLAAAALACLAFTATSAHAAMLTEGVFHIVGGNAFNVSVYPDNAGFYGADGANGVVDEKFNNPIAAYRFFTDAGVDNYTAATYASGGAGIISDASPLEFRTGYFGSPDNANVWETTDPGTGYANPADFTNNTMLGNTTNVEGSIDISELTTGSIYFFYGAYRSRPVFNLTMSDTDGPEADILLTDVGDNDSANNNEFYACSIDFVNDAGYDEISYVHPNSRITSNGGSGRFMGVVVTAPPTIIIPEPSTFLIWALGLLGLGWYAWRRRK